MEFLFKFFIVPLLYLISTFYLIRFHLHPVLVLFTTTSLTYYYYHKKNIQKKKRDTLSKYSDEKYKFEDIEDAEYKDQPKK